jgi:Rho-binding antiterminator
LRYNPKGLYTYLLIMKERTEAYQAIPATFREEIQDFMRRRKYLRIHYFNPYHEYISTAALIKEIFDQDGAEYMRLSTGEEVRLDWIVRLDGQAAPGYDIQDFTCDC